jgi:hypothetical protein
MSEHQPQETKESVGARKLRDADSTEGPAARSARYLRATFSVRWNRRPLVARRKYFAKVADTGWFEIAMEHCRVKVQTIGPSHGPALGVNPDLSEVCRIVKG